MVQRDALYVFIVDNDGKYINEILPIQCKAWNSEIYIAARFIQIFLRFSIYSREIICKILSRMPSLVSIEIEIEYIPLRLG